MYLFIILASLVSVFYISPSTQHSRRNVVHLSIYSSFAVQTLPVSVSSCRTALRLPNTGGASLNASLSPSTQHPRPALTNHLSCRTSLRLPNIPGLYQSLVSSHISPSTQRLLYQSVLSHIVSPSTQHPPYQSVLSHVPPSTQHRWC